MNHKIYGGDGRNFKHCSEPSCFLPEAHVSFYKELWAGRTLKEKFWVANNRAIYHNVIKTNLIVGGCDA